MDEYSRVVHVTPGGLLIVPDADGICGNSKILRPRLDQCPDLADRLQDSTIGITKICHILAAMNTPLPSRCGLQRNADRVARYHCPGDNG